MTHLNPRARLLLILAALLILTTSALTLALIPWLGGAS